MQCLPFLQTLLDLIHRGHAFQVETPTHNESA